MIPPRSPYCLIQEDLWPNEWRILVSCVLLNRTARKQVERVLPDVFKLCPTASHMANCDIEQLSSIIAPLGFKNRRANSLVELSKKYLASNWKHAKDLPGIGEYGAAVWDIFVIGEIPKECPKDHALTLWWNWYVHHDASPRHEKL